MKFSLFGDFLYKNAHRELIAFAASELQEAFDQLESYKDDFYCIGYVSYEAYKAFEDPAYRSSKPLLYFALFEERERFEPPVYRQGFCPFDLKFIDEASYIHKIEALKSHIALGNTYQGNFTTFLEFETIVPSFELFCQLLHQQNTDYKAFLPTPYGDILSFSPELFFDIKHNQITTKPMKGTMPRGKNVQEDEANKNFLASDIKNRSENVMIVDLLRNDLSKIVRNGSLKVERLFEVETYPTLFQMTSTISGDLKPHCSLFEIFKALFPCGSITGAPKKITTEILQSLEESERGVYCGAIGMLSQDQMTFSIPIRTIYKQDRHCFYGVGSGIVWDSVPRDEYRELQTKMSFLYAGAEFALLETMLYTPEEITQEFLTLPKGLVWLPLHLKRLRDSAKSLGFCFLDTLIEELQDLRFQEKKIIRLLLARDGQTSIEILPFQEITSCDVRLQEKPKLCDLDLFKTSLHRIPIEVREQNLFDVIYHHDGILLEGSRSNLVLELDGVLVTPEFEHNFLRGTCREEMLRRGIVQERVLRVEDLKRAERVFCLNSVRGLQEVNLL
ncbi:aminodeoxychorismate synthase component I [Helicobacter pametensis]|uniref:aminodeoxychorismate synthase component I n=1 Tax=Helicobacter pametensis TaxID=95149 RepID=UPI0004AC9271|nr:aminodeoxychorismate synthase component I [Helicobacter pametensis]